MLGLEARASAASFCRRTGGELLDELDNKLMVPVAFRVLDLGSVMVTLPLVVDHKLVLKAILAGQRQEGAILALMVMGEIDVLVFNVVAYG